MKTEQTKLQIFDDSPHYSESVCKRISEYCDTYKREIPRNYQMLSIKEVLNTINAH